VPVIQGNRSLPAKSSSWNRSNPLAQTGLHLRRDGFAGSFFSVVACSCV
jgi:hypothetical protein